jgi:hypothetical protein
MTVTPDQLAAILGGATTLPPAPKPEIHRNDWPTCGDPACGEKLDPLWHAAGLHPGCEWPCNECLSPNEDPAPWCDCRDDEQCKGPCRKRAHNPQVHQHCQLCDTDMHRCPGCGESVRHGQPACRQCLTNTAIATSQPEIPPSTVAELRDLLINHDNNSPRSLQAAIGPSEIGVPCDRQLGMRLHSLPRRPDPRVPWAPILGTATHTYIADVLRAHNKHLGRQRWIVEERVWPDDMISGSGDAYDTDQATVVDWKLVGANSLKKYRKTVRPEYRIQAHLYGLGHQRAGRPVRHVRLVYLARDHDFDKSFEWTEPYDPQVAEDALERMYKVMNLLQDLGVADNPALWGAVPAIPTPDCVWCPYFRPGKPADGTGCPGDEAAQDRYTTRFADGLIISAAKEHTPL